MIEPGPVHGDESTDAGRLRWALGDDDRGGLFGPLPFGAAVEAEGPDAEEALAALADLMAALEVGLVRWFEEQGVDID